MKKNNLFLKILLLSIFLLVFSALGYYFYQKNNLVDLTDTKTPLGSVSGKLSGWVTYWDQVSINSEVAVLSDDLETISIFSAYFDNSNNVILPSKTQNLIAELEKKEYKKFKKYLTIVNDKEISNGNFSLKDKEMLFELFGSEKSRSSHIDEIISLTKKYNLDGIDVDYEALKKDTALWQLYMLFVSELWTVAKEKNLEVRIILEPAFPTKGVTYPAGPEYVIMCYNLYGTSTIPGPKANMEFLKKLADNSKVLPGIKIFALASGGVEWTYSDKISGKQIKETYAIQLLNEKGITPSRDSNSGVLNFVYYDENSKKHEVWFADGETIKQWMNKLMELGENNFSLWRIGVNSNDSLKKIISD